MDVIVFTEVKLKSSFPVQLYSLRGFTQFSCLRSSQGGGGVIVFVRSSVSAEQVILPDAPFEKILLNMTFDTARFRLIAYYRAPCHTNLCDFMEDLENELASADTKTLVIGDININSESPVMDAPSRRYCELLESYDYKVTNNLPTRRASGKTIDHLATNFYDVLRIQNDTIEVDDSLSDHNIVISTIFCGHKTPKQLEKVSRTEVDYALLAKNFPDINEITLSSHDTNEIVDYITDAVKSALNRSSVVRNFTVKHSERINIWSSARALELMAEKDKWLRKRRAKPSSEFYQRKVKEVSNELLILNKAEYIHHVHQKVTTRDPKKLWRGLNEVLGRNNNRIVPSISNGGETFTDPTIVANLFNDFFSNCAQNLLDSTSFDGVQPNPANYQPRSMFLKPTDVSEVMNIITTMKSNSAAGHDGITPLTVKRLAHVIAPLLVHLINAIFESSEYPRSLKVAVVTPIFKSGSRTSVDNYRPISVLPVFNKIVERVIHNRLSNYFSDHLKIVYSHQFGFRQQSGTENAAIELTNILLRAIDEKKIATGVFMDLRKAFDVVDHKLLLEVLENYGVRGKVNALLASYLQDRQQIVKVDNKLSDAAPINTGVVQGSCLGPLLFLIFINDAGNLQTNGQLFLFADDALQINIHEKVEPTSNLAVIKSDMTKILDFFTQRKLILNSSKTNFMVFSSPARKVKFPQSIEIASNLTIHRVEFTKYLGLYIHEHLSWSRHIENVEKKIAPANGILWKLRNVLPFHAKKLVYNSLLQSHLNFMSTIWGLASCDALSNAQILQNRALRNVYNLPYRANRVEMYTHRVESHLPIRGICLLNIATYMFKSLHNQTVTNIKYSTGEKIHARNLRNSTQLRPAIKRNQFGAKSIETIGPEVYNKVPEDIKRLRTQQAFKWTLKCHLRDEKFISSCFNKTFFNLLL